MTTGGRERALQEVRAALREREVTLRAMELELEGRARDHDTVVRGLHTQLADAQHKLKVRLDSKARRYWICRRMLCSSQSSRPSA